MYQERFIQAIHDKRKIRLSFFSKEDGRVLVRKCAPMDYDPNRKAKDKTDRFHVWDYESDRGQHTLGLKPEQVSNIEVLNEVFDPAEFVRWTTNWFIARDWGEFS